MDVTERMAAETALEQSNTILGAVVDDSPLAIVIASPELTINRWNRAAEKQFGWTAQEAIGQSLFILIPDSRRQEFAEHRTLKDRLGLAVYFAEPYRPWQRGANENFNGLLRQFFPKGTDFTRVAPRDATVRAIRGDGLPSHGSREMPVYGHLFRRLRPRDPGAGTRIDALVNYLEQIQDRPAP